MEEGRLRSANDHRPREAGKGSLWAPGGPGRGSSRPDPGIPAGNGVDERLIPVALAESQAALREVRF